MSTVQEKFATFARRQSVVAAKEPRVVFVSLDCFELTWRQCPQDVLFHCLVCVRAPRRFLGALQLDEETCDLLRLKDAQGLVLWCDLEDATPAGGEAAMASVWEQLSEALRRVDNPATGLKYAPLRLGLDFWCCQFDEDLAVFCSDAGQVLTELATGAWELQAVMEVIHQSNPTLVPLALWNEDLWQGCYEFAVSAAIRRKSCASMGFLSPTPSPLLLASVPSNVSTLSGMSSGRPRPRLSVAQRLADPVLGAVTEQERKRHLKLEHSLSLNMQLSLPRTRPVLQCALDFALLGADSDDEDTDDEEEDELLFEVLEECEIEFEKFEKCEEAAGVVECGLEEATRQSVKNEEFASRPVDYDLRRWVNADTRPGVARV